MENVMNVIARVNDAINNVVWGIPMLILIIGTGIYMTIGMKFFQITRIKHWMNETFLAIFKKKHVTAHTGKDESSISQFQALSTALAATIGVGNIAGVAGAIITGGAGAVFWMWLSALFGMMTNYSENVLGIYYRRKNSKDEWSGGAMYYLQDGLKGKKIIGAAAKPLAILFSLFCVFASFGIGNMTQVHEIASSLQDTFKIPPIATGIIISVIAALVILGGIKTIGNVTEKIVPFMACAYILGTIIVLVMNITSVPAVFGAIFTNAFGLRPIAGATVGLMIKQAMTMGFKRGVFSNEAGLGSSVMVHSASNVVEPITQGMWGIFEVFFDTGASLVSEALSEGLGTLAGGFVAIAICLFAFSTVLGWSFYGTKSCEYLFGTRATIVYKIIFIVCIIFGATMSFDLAWAIADTLNALMAIPNLIGVLALSGTVFAITKNYLARKVTKTDVNARPMLSFDPQIQQMQEKVLKQHSET